MILLLMVWMGYMEGIYSFPPGIRGREKILWTREVVLPNYTAN